MTTSWWRAATSRPGERVELDGESFVIPAAVELGHKLARRALAADTRVLKYGAPIGSMKTAGGARRTRSPAQPAQRLHSIDDARRGRTDIDEHHGHATKFHERISCASDGRKGIRNVVAVAYLVECAHHVSRLIVQRSGADDVHLIGFPGCYPNKYSLEMMQRLCTHPNVGAVLLVSLGCEGFNREQLRKHIARQRPARRPAGHPAVRRHHAHAECRPRHREEDARRTRAADSRCPWRSTN